MSGETKLGIRMLCSMRLLYLLRQVLRMRGLLMKLLGLLLMMLRNLRLMLLMSIIVIVTERLLLSKLLKWRSRSNSMRRRRLSGLYGLRDGSRH